LRYLFSWMWFLPPLAVGWTLRTASHTRKRSADMAWVAPLGQPGWFHPSGSSGTMPGAGTRLITFITLPKAKRGASGKAGFRRVQRGSRLLFEIDFNA
jgi:hypothetical protein